MAERAELGDEVKDIVTGMKGIVVARTEWLYGCIRLLVQPEGRTSDGKQIENFQVDEPQAKIIKKQKVKMPQQWVLADPQPKAPPQQQASRSHGGGRPNSFTR